MQLIACFLVNGVVQIEEKPIYGVQNLRQAISYIGEREPELWQFLQHKKLSIAVAKSINDPPIIWTGEGDFESFDGMGVLLLIEAIEGNAIFTLIATAVASLAVSAGVSGTILGIGTAALIGEAVATLATAVLTIGASFAFNAILQALSPNTTSKSHGSSSIFSQELNSDAEGNVVPWLIGETLGGGVIIGKVSSTYDVLDSQLTSTPTYPTDTPYIYQSQLHLATPGRWYKLLRG